MIKFSRCIIVVLLSVQVLIECSYANAKFTHFRRTNSAAKDNVRSISTELEFQPTLNHVVRKKRQGIRSCRSSPLYPEDQFTQSYAKAVEFEPIFVDREDNLVSLLSQSYYDLSDYSVRKGYGASKPHLQYPQRGSWQDKYQTLKPALTWQEYYKPAKIVKDQPQQSSPSSFSIGGSQPLNPSQLPIGFPQFYRPNPAIENGIQQYNPYSGQLKPNFPWQSGFQDSSFASVPQNEIQQLKPGFQGQSESQHYSPASTQNGSPLKPVFQEQSEYDLSNPFSWTQSSDKPTANGQSEYQQFSPSSSVQSEAQPTKPIFYGQNGFSGFQFMKPTSPLQGESYQSASFPPFQNCYSQQLSSPFWGPEGLQPFRPVCTEENSVPFLGPHLICQFVNYPSKPSLYGQGGSQSQQSKPSPPAQSSSQHPESNKPDINDYHHLKPTASYHDEHKPQKPSSSGQGASSVLYHNEYKPQKPSSSGQGAPSASYYNEYKPQKPSSSEQGASLASYYNEYKPQKPSPSGQGASSASYYNEYKPQKPSSSGQGASLASYYNEYKPQTPSSSGQGASLASYYNEYKPQKPSSSEQGASSASYYNEYKPQKPSPSGQGASSVHKPISIWEDFLPYYSTTSSTSDGQQSNPDSSDRGGIQLLNPSLEYTEFQPSDSIRLLPNKNLQPEKLHLPEDDFCSIPVWLQIPSHQSEYLRPSFLGPQDLTSQELQASKKTNENRRPSSNQSPELNDQVFATHGFNPTLLDTKTSFPPAPVQEMRYAYQPYTIFAQNEDWEGPNFRFVSEGPPSIYRCEGTDEYDHIIDLNRNVQNILEPMLGQVMANQI